MTFSLSNQAVSHSIDQILTQGAQKLYDKYITAKIPNSLSSKLSKFINIVFDPITNPNQTKQNNDPFRIHQSIRQKLQLAKNDKAKRADNLLRAKEDKLKENQLKASRTINLKTKKELGVELGRSFKTSRIGNSVQFSQRNRSKQSRFQKLDEDNQQAMSFRVVRDDKSKRYDQQQDLIAINKEKQKRIQQHRQCLQGQYKSLQEAGGVIAFDYESCQMIFPDPKQKKPQKSFQNHQKNIILFLQPTFGEENRTNNSQQKQRTVRYTRKITSFQRTRKHKVRQIQDQDYNNQGERQYSTIPYMQVEQGIKMTEQGSHRTIERPQTSRKTSSASTQRTFKSFTRQKIESLGAFRTSQLIPQRPESRYQQQTGIKKSANHSERQSILWSGKISQRDHKINKHIDNFALFFQQTCQPEQK